MILATTQWKSLKNKNFERLRSESIARLVSPNVWDRVEITALDLQLENIFNQDFFAGRLSVLVGISGIGELQGENEFFRRK